MQLPCTTAFEAVTRKLRPISSGNSEDNGVRNFRNSVVFPCDLDYAVTKRSRRRLRSSLDQAVPALSTRVTSHRRISWSI